MKKYLLFWALFLLPVSIYSMEKSAAESSQVKEQATVKADDECMVCLGEAQELSEEKGPDVIRRTNCCKKFLCADCEKDLAKSGITKCPNCQREGLTTSSAVIEKEQKEEPKKQQAQQQNNKAQEMLQKAILNNSEKEIKEAIQAGADVNKADVDGKTPIWLALLTKHYESVVLLIESGAEITLEYRGKNFVQLFLNNGATSNPYYIKCLALLVANNIDFSKTTKNITDYVSNIVINSPNITRHKTETAKLYMQNIFELIQQFADHKYDVINKIWNSGNLSVYKDKDLIALCLKYGIDLNKSVTIINRTLISHMPPLFIAVSSDNVTALSALLDAGADINILADPAGKGMETPLSWALETARPNAIKFLMSRGAKTPSELK